MKLTNRLKHAWNVFKDDADTNFMPPASDVVVYGSSMNRPRIYRANSSRFAAAIFTRIAIDVSMTQFNHVKINEKNEDIEVIKSGLNNCLTVEANRDQTAIQFLHDIAFSLLDEGRIAVVPIDTSIKPKTPGSFDIETMRVGPITGWTNRSVQVHLYDENAGVYKDIWIPKDKVAIIENPLYYVINEPNSTLQRLLNKMAIIDQQDNMYATNRLDVVIQTSQTLKTPLQVENAKARIKNIDHQLAAGNNGIAYIDGTEKLTQLNRPANSQIGETAEKLKQEFYNQLGLTQAIFDGTATEAQIRNYYNRTVDPIILFIIQEFERKFLTKTARTQGHAIEHYRNTLKFVSAEQLISLGDAFRRNEIATSNEIRKLVGFKRSNEPVADKLTNPNISEKNKAGGVGSATKGDGESARDIQKIQNEAVSVRTTKEE